MAIQLYMLEQLQQVNGEGIILDHPYPLENMSAGIQININALGPSFSQYMLQEGLLLQRISLKELPMIMEEDIVSDEIPYTRYLYSAYDAVSNRL